MSSKPPCQIAVYRTYGRSILNRYEWVSFVEDKNGCLVKQLSGHTVTLAGAVYAALTKTGIYKPGAKGGIKEVFSYDNRGRTQ